VFLDWGRLPYREAWARQKELVELRARDEIPDTIVFCEHEPVITLGRGGQRGADGKRQGEGQPVVLGVPAFVEIVETERGGSATYHGPGQLVIYPIVRIASSHGRRSFRSGVTEFLRFLETVLLRFAVAHGLEARTIEGQTGVWVKHPSRPGERKVASLGIALRHWVTYHGAALNLSTGPEPWTWIQPCGFEASVMTDLERETGQKINYLDAVRELRKLLSSLVEETSRESSGASE